MPEKLGAFGVGFLFVYFLLIPPSLSLFGLGIWASNRLLFDLNSEMIHALLKGYLVLHLLSEKSYVLFIASKPSDERRNNLLNL